MKNDLLVHWGSCFALLSLLVAWRVDKRVPRIYSVTLFYLLGLANAVLCFRALGYNLAIEAQKINPLTKAPTHLLATTSFAAFTTLLTAMGAYYADRIDCKRILKWSLITYGIVGSILYCGFKVKIIPHESSNATLMALSLPYLLPEKLKQWKRWLATLLIIVAIIDSDASSPVGVSCVVIGVTLFLRGYYKLLLACPVPLIAAVVFYGPHRIFDDTDRFAAYSAFMGYWWNDSWSVILFGYGPGTFETLSQIIQEKVRFGIRFTDTGRMVGELWLHMHSDILEFIWKYGTIGAGLITACGVKLFKGLSGIEERTIFIGILSSGVFDFPFSYPGVPVVLILLFGVMMRGEVDSGK